MKKVKATLVRLCAPSLKFVDYNKQTGEFEGVFSEPAKMIYGVFASTFNVSMVTADDTKKNVIDPSENGKLRGCFGLLQRGEADVNLYPYEMPLINIENVTQINSSALSTGTYMLAPYSINESRRIEHGPLDSFTSVSTEVWLNGAVIVIMFAMIMYYVKLFVYKCPTSEDEIIEDEEEKVEKQQDEALYGQSLLYQVITHMMQFETCDYTGDTVRYVSLLMSVFAFLFITFFSCMITSESASSNNFLVYDTYEKILANKDVQPVWVENLNDVNQYKRASTSSMSRELWQQSQEISSKSGGKTSSLLETSLESILKFAPVARNKQLLIFVSKIFTPIFIKVMCTALNSDFAGFDGIKDLRLKGRLDENIATSLYVLPISRLSSVSEVAEYGLQRVIEAHLLHQPDLIHLIGLYFA